MKNKPPTKAEVKAFIESRGCTAKYSGNTRTMYITGETALITELAVLKTFNPPFKTQSHVLSTQK